MAEDTAQLLAKGLQALAQRDHLNAFHYLQAADWQRFGKPWNACNSEERVAFFESPQFPPEAVPLHKLQHDLEQIKYLRKNQKLPDEFQSVENALEQVYASLLQRFQNVSETELLWLSPQEQELLAPFWNRNLYTEPLPESPEPLINPALDTDRVCWNYHHNQPGLAYCDQILAAPALTQIREFVLASTLWRDYQRGGYVGSYLPNGFCAPLLLQLADQVRAAFSPILQDLPLSLMWSYKYSQNSPGVGIHADSGGRVNVNFWLTPDHANLEPEKGGLIVYDVMAPSDWDPRRYQLETLLKGKPCKAYPIS